MSLCHSCITKASAWLVFIPCERRNIMLLWSCPQSHSRCSCMEAIHVLLQEMSDEGSCAGHSLFSASDLELMMVIFTQLKAEMRLEHWADTEHITQRWEQVVIMLWMCWNLQHSEHQVLQSSGGKTWIYFSSVSLKRNSWRFFVISSLVLDGSMLEVTLVWRNLHLLNASRVTWHVCTQFFFQSRHHLRLFFSCQHFGF